MAEQEGITRDTFKTYDMDAKLLTLFDMQKETQGLINTRIENEAKQKDYCEDRAKTCVKRFQQLEGKIKWMIGGTTGIAFCITAGLLIFRFFA